MSGPIGPRQTTTRKGSEWQAQIRDICCPDSWPVAARNTSAGKGGPSRLENAAGIVRRPIQTSAVPSEAGTDANYQSGQERRSPMPEISSQSLGEDGSVRI